MTLFLSIRLDIQLEGVIDYTTCTNITICRCNKEMTSVNCSHGGLTSIPKIPTTALTLDLSYNEIGTIPALAFSKLLKLQNLDLRRNQIQTVESSTFEGLESLTTIDLSGNNINTIPTRVFSKLSELHTLQLNFNKIHSVEPYAFDGLHNLITLNLRRNKLQTLENRSFANMPRLNNLDLSLNGKQKIAIDAFTGTHSISYISLYGNSLSEIPSIGSQPRLSQIDLSWNMIVNASFPSTYMNSYKNLSIDFARNKIETLDNLTFTSLAGPGTTIWRMVLFSNNISSVGPGTFDVFKSIEHLYLSHNILSIEALENIADNCRRTRVKYLHLSAVFRTQNLLKTGTSAFMNLGIRLGLYANFHLGFTSEEFGNLTFIQLTKYELFQFSALNFPAKKNVLAMDLAENIFLSFPKNLPSSLEILDLRGNTISELNRNDLMYLGSLRKLFLSKNEIILLLPGAFNGLGKLQVLDLAQNKIGIFLENTFESLHNLTHLYLGRNRITHLPKLSELLVSLRVLDLSDNGCEIIDKPFSESFPSLQTLKLEGNHLGKHEFPSDRDGRLFKGLTKLEEVFISSNNIKSLPDWIFHDQISLKLLNISANKISGWGPNVFKFTKNIAKLDLSYNLISILTENNLQNLNDLQQLYLKGNPFICNCDLLWFRDWIDRTSINLPDKESYTCHGPEAWRDKSLLEFTKDKINCTMIPTIVGAVSAALIFSLISGIVVYKNRWRLRLRVYLMSKRGRVFVRTIRGREQRTNYEAINDDGRQDFNDAYISCSYRDYDWVIHQLLPGIDNGHYDDDTIFGGDFKLYFDPRDKEPGNVYTPNMTCCIICTS